MELLYSDDAAAVQETYVTPSGLNVLISKTEIPEQEGGSVPSPAVDWYTAYFTLDGVFFPVPPVHLRLTAVPFPSFLYLPSCFPLSYHKRPPTAGGKAGGEWGAAAVCVYGERV